MQRKTARKVIFLILMTIIVLMCIVAIFCHPDNQDQPIVPNVIKIKHSLVAMNMANGNKKRTIRKGTRLYYKKEKQGILVWSKHYPKDIHHQYILMPSRTVNRTINKSKQK